MSETKLELPTMKLEAPPTGFRFHPEWETVKDVGPVTGEPHLKLVKICREGEDYVTGDVMLERAEEMSDLAGQSHAERLLEKQKEIPVEWRPHSLIFPGTVRRDPDGGLYVACLRWLGRSWCWCLYFDWLDDGFDSYCRIVRLRK